MNNSETKSKN